MGNEKLNGHFVRKLISCPECGKFSINTDWCLFCGFYPEELEDDDREPDGDKE